MLLAVGKRGLAEPGGSGWTEVNHESCRRGKGFRVLSGDLRVSDNLSVALREDLGRVWYGFEFPRQFLRVQHWKNRKR